MAQTLELQIRGRYTHQNPLSEVPPGALLVAKNLVIDRESIADSRRGYRQYGDPLTDLHKLMVYRDVLLAHADAAVNYDSDDAGTWVAYSGTFNAPSASVQMQGVESNKSFYFTTDLGVYRLDEPTGTPRRSGIVRALDGTGATTGASGFMANNTSVAYRILWGYRDINNRLLLGSPSARIIVRNTSGGTRNVALEFTIPSEVDTTYFYQIYRSEQALSATDEPSDEQQLVIEKIVTGAEITAGVVTITDSILDDFKGAFIYTAPSQQGILQANDRPPIALDLTEFRQHNFYANTQQPWRVIVSMTANFVIADTVTIAGTVYTASAAENIAADQFLVGATIVDTLRSLIRVANRSATNTLVYLYEIDQKTFFVETRTLPGATFTVTSSNTTIFSKAVPISADNEVKVNRVHISKPGIGDAASLLSFFDVGSGNKAIRRILSVRDAVFVLKEDGIYRITGTDLSNFVLEAHDITVEIVGANTAVALDNQVFCMSNRGVISVSVSGVDDTVGRPIERDLLRLSAFDNFETLAWAVNYDSDRKYILAVPSEPGDVAASEFHVFNYFTKAWTTWEFSAVSALVNTRNKKLYIARYSDDQVIEERKSFDLTDYADDEYAVTISSFTTDTVTVVSVPAGVVVGMSLKQGSSAAVITDITGLVLTVATANLPWTAAAAAIYTPIPTELEWLKNAAGNPGILKHFAELTYFFEDARFRNITARFGSNFLSGFKSVTLRAKASGPWGQFSWGGLQWGGGFGGDQPIRTYFPKESTRAHWVNLRLELEQAFTAFTLSGASIIYHPMSERFK